MKRAASIGLATFIVFSTTLPCAALAAQHAGATPAPSGGAEVTSPKIRELLTLLGDPSVQAWLKHQNDAKSSAASGQNIAEESISKVLDARLAAIREHIVALGRTVPDLPNQFWRGGARVTEDLGENGRVEALVLLAMFVGLGAGIEWLFRRTTQRVRRHLDALRSETAKGRLHLAALRFAFGVGLVTAFAVGSIGPFLALDWPPLLRQMLFGLLVAVFVVRVTNAVGHFLLAPHHERFRIIPMDTMAARFWHRRLVAFVGWFAFGWVTVGFGVTLGYTLEARQLVAYAFGLGLLAIALEAVWRRPAALAEGNKALSLVTGRFGRGTANTAITVGIVALWVLWIAHAMASFWLILVIITLPLAIGMTRRAVDNLLRPPGSEQVADGAPSVLAVCIERGIQAALIIVAVAVLAWGWGVDLAHLRGQESWVGRLADGVLSTIVILLTADFSWQAVKTAIDRKLTETADPSVRIVRSTRWNSRLAPTRHVYRG